MSELYIGLMSGTSADGIDLALVDFSQAQPKLITTHYQPYSEVQREKILAVCSAKQNEISHYAELDVELGKLFAHTINAFIAAHKINKEEIRAIGSHGQTIRHIPNAPLPYTLQIGDPNIIAAETNITTVADFRRKDMAYGGQGAPLVPAFHQKIFADLNKNRAIVNIGGIANVTILFKDKTVLGFDTGPGNLLLDAWMMKHKNNAYDQDGAWARSGNVHEALLAQLLEDAYFHKAPPKSTGREYFNLSWLQEKIAGFTAADVQATLTELTARSILEAITPHIAEGDIFICGGGAHNQYLMERLQQLAAPNYLVRTTDSIGIAPDWVEAMTFAWLAYQTLARKPGNMPSVTGATREAVLGAVYFV